MRTEVGGFGIDENFDLGGVSSKIVVKDAHEEYYILKFGKYKDTVLVKDYLSEFVACKLAALLGYDVQEVKLSYYNGLECVAIKMFPYEIVTFSGFGESTNPEGVVFEYDLDSLFDLPFSFSKFSMNQAQFSEYVWKIFSLDMLLGNFDRHENNWGFYKKEGVYYPAAMYDLGASFFPKLIPTCGEYSNSEIRHLIEFDSRCAIQCDGKKKNYFQILEKYRANTDLKKHIQYLLKKWRSLEIDPILKQVVDYGYPEYASFVKKVLDLKFDKLGEFYADN